MLNCLWLSFSFRELDKIYTIITLSSLLVIQVISLINYINKTNFELSRFFAALKDEGSSTQLKFNDNKGAFKELASTLNEVADLIGQSRIKSEKSSKYFEFVVEHIPIGILTVNETGNIIHTNQALKKLLCLESVNSLGKIKSTIPDLHKELDNINPGDQKVIRLKINNQFTQILVRSTKFKFENDHLKLISFQDVKNELEENELISWQKLIRILTHEIMNSITPISNLTLAINKCLTIDGEPGTIENLDNDQIKDALINTSLIEDRSAGLQEFVEKYRSLTKIQALKISKIELTPLFHKIILLFQDSIDKNNIKIATNTNPEAIMIEADKKLIEQILINLLKNAIESIIHTDHKEIKMIAHVNADKRTEISVVDNGPGIPDEIIDQIFMPFFTTKEQGSGIGLSLARQIMRLHGGSISAQSSETETSFSLQF